MTNKVLIPAVCAVAGVAAGFVGGFIFAKAKYKKFYENKYDNDIYAMKKKEAKADAELHATTEEEAKKINESFPSELWTEQFKKDQEKRKDYKNLVRKEGYIPDDDKEENPEVFNAAKFDRENYSKCEEEFKERVKLFSEYSGISEEALMQGEVRIISEEEYYEGTHESEPTELEWDMRAHLLTGVDGDIYEPQVTFGDDWEKIIELIEELRTRNPESDVWIYDERIEEFYCVTSTNP